MSVLIVTVSSSMVTLSLTAHVQTHPVNATTGIVKSLIDIMRVVQQTCNSLIAVSLSEVSRTMPLELPSVMLLIILYTLARRRLETY